MGVLSDAANLPGGLAVGQQDQPPIPQGGPSGGYAGMSGAMAPAPDVQNADAVTQEGINHTATQGQISRGASPQQSFHKVLYEQGPDGQTNITVKMPQTTFDTLSQLMQTGQATISAFDQARQQLAAKQQFLQQNPIVAGLGSIFSSAAAQYAGGPHQAGRIAPLVRAAGAYGLQTFGESPDILAQKQAQLQDQEFQVSRQLQSATDEQTKLGLETQNTAIQAQQSQIQLAREANQDQDKVYSQFSAIASKPTPMTAATLQNAADQLKAKGATQQQADQKVATLKAENEAAIAAKGAEKVATVGKGSDGRLHNFEVWLDPRTQKEVGRVDLGVKEPTYAEQLAQQKKADNAQIIENLAQRAASNDPNQFADPRKEVSLRGNDLPLARIYDRAAQLNPNATPSSIDAKTKLYADYNSGNTSLAFQSQGQFLQHADALQQAMAKLQNTGSPLLNKPINQLVKKDLEGNPDLQAAIVALNPVKDEFGKFLISSASSSSRALHESDRKSGDEMFSTNQSLNQIQAGLHQAAETTNAVNSELYQRWQRVFPGSNMPLPYSPGAQVAAQNLGINLNQAPPGAPAQGVQQGPTQPARAAQQAAPQQLTSKSGRPIKPDGKGGFVYAD